MWTPAWGFDRWERLLQHLQTRAQGNSHPPRHTHTCTYTQSQSHSQQRRRVWAEQRAQRRKGVRSEYGDLWGEGVRLSRLPYCFLISEPSVWVRIQAVSELQLHQHAQPIEERSLVLIIAITPSRWVLNMHGRNITHFHFYYYHLQQSLAHSHTRRDVTSNEDPETLRGVRITRFFMLNILAAALRWYLKGVLHLSSCFLTHFSHSAEEETVRVMVCLPAESERWSNPFVSVCWNHYCLVFICMQWLIYCIPMYADDTVIDVHAETNQKATIKLKTAMTPVAEWLKNSWLHLNTWGKGCMIFTKRSMDTITPDVINKKGWLMSPNINMRWIQILH